MELTQTPLTILMDKIGRMRPRKESQKIALACVVALIKETEHVPGSGKTLLDFERETFIDLYHKTPDKELIINHNKNNNAMTTQDNAQAQDDFQIVIEDNVPLDGKFGNAGKSSKYWPYLEKLQPGQSFSFPTSDYNKIQHIMNVAKVELPEHRFAIRTISTTHKRIWRRD